MQERGAIDASRQLMEKYSEVQSELNMIFIDLKKAYDRVPRQDIWRSMREKGVAEKYVRMLKEMYEGEVVQSSVGRTKGFPEVSKCNQKSDNLRQNKRADPPVRASSNREQARVSPPHTFHDRVHTTHSVRKRMNFLNSD
ncbi:hypothetical protein J437_LFUL018214 [Ladona fulva]|uniref:Reverse transcriptase domain-containing protein n=1 Tax=Ladona fulva TaxID=123851 RepID=A0A8K0KM24_LADFU|nr:hypothetical protein J437_LFUL018214 [Ladona fulva]